MRVLPYEEFEHIVDAMRDNIDRLDKVAEALNCAEVFELSMSNEVTKLLAYIFKDTNNWIDYWAYERDFGRDWYDGCAQEMDGSNIDLSTTRKLYEFLINNM